ncbi:MAG: metabolite traffic protein EboE [Myxococcota bacterium]
MKLQIAGQPHLTWLSAVHGGETWPEILRALKEHALPIKQRVSPGAPVGLGLRLGAVAAEQLAVPDEMAAFRAWLEEHALYVFTLHGATFGALRGKQDVYLPDWLDEARLFYTERLASLLAALLPSGMPSLTGSISTVPGALRSRLRTTSDVEALVERLVRLAASLHRLWEESGRIVVAALEPEPCCLLDNASDTVGFFENHLFSRGAIRRLLQVSGCNRATAEPILRRHLGVCVDAAHAAAGWEEPRKVVGAMLHAGIQVAKVQLGVCAEVSASSWEGALDALRTLADDRRPVQVVEQRSSRTTRHADVSELVDRARTEGAGRVYRARVHLPPSAERHDDVIRATTPQLLTLTRWLGTVAATQHLEVEVDARYLTTEGMAAELEWTRAALSG